MEVCCQANNGDWNEEKLFCYLRDLIKDFAQLFIYDFMGAEPLLDSAWCLIYQRHYHLYRPWSDLCVTLVNQ